VKGTAMKCERAISEMEKLLMMWMEAKIQKYVPPSLMMLQAKPRNLFEGLKGKYSVEVQAFAASSAVPQYTIVLLVYFWLSSVHHCIIGIFLAYVFVIQGVMNGAGGGQIRHE
jgi:hypothetical protein